MDWTKVRDNVRTLLDSQQGLVQAFEWNGGSYEGTRTILRRQDYNTDDGLMSGDYQFSILCHTAQFRNGFPAPRTDKLTIGGTQYRVLSIDADAIGACIKINLGSLLA